MTLCVLPIMFRTRKLNVAKRKSDLEGFMKEVEEESLAAGETDALLAYGEHFRLALAVIQLRKKSGGHDSNWRAPQGCSRARSAASSGARATPPTEPFRRSLRQPR